METIDDETSAAAIDFIKRQAQANKPFFCWWNAHAHASLHACAAGDAAARAASANMPTAWSSTTATSADLLKALDDLGIANNTIVIYTTDNGPHMNSWPDGGMTPFRSEKNTNWEGAFRVPAMIRWPGHIKPGQVSNEIFAALDWFPTLLAAAGDAGRQEQAAHGLAAPAGKTFKVHLDGYNQLPLPDRASRTKSARKEFFYFNDDGELVAMRYENWKLVFCEQRDAGHAARSGPSRSPACGCRRCSTCAWTPTSGPTSRRTPTTTGCSSASFLAVPAQALVAQFIETFKDFPPRQKPSSFSVDQIVGRR